MVRLALVVRALLIVALAGSLFVVDLIYPLVDPRIRYRR